MPPLMATKTFPLLLIIEEGKDTKRVFVVGIGLVKIDCDRRLTGLDYGLPGFLKAGFFSLFSFALCETKLGLKGCPLQRFVLYVAEISR